MGQTLKDTYAKILKEQTLYPWTDNAVPLTVPLAKSLDVLLMMLSPVWEYQYQICTSLPRDYHRKG